MKTSVQNKSSGFFRGILAGLSERGVDVKDPLQVLLAVRRIGAPALEATFHPGERDPSLPDIPTLKELGINVSTWGSVKGVGAPAGTPKEVVEYLEGLLKKICDDPEFKKIMADLDQPIMYLNGADFAKFLQEASADYGKLIKDLNITIQ